MGGWEGRKSGYGEEKNNLKPEAGCWSCRFPENGRMEPGKPGDDVIRDLGQ